LVLLLALTTALIASAVLPRLLGSGGPVLLLAGSAALRLIAAHLTLQVQMT